MTDEPDIWQCKEYLDDIEAANPQMFSDWEKKFIESMKERVACFVPITEHMVKALEAIYVKTSQEQVMISQEQQINDSMEIMDEFGTPWEIDFLTNVHGRLVERRQALTASQADTLDRIYRKLCDAEERNMKGC